MSGLSNVPRLTILVGAEEQASLLVGNRLGPWAGNPLGRPD